MNLWIDLDNIPHVAIFRPLLEIFRKRGLNLLVTARDFQGTIALCRFWNIEHVPIGHHGGPSKVGKLINLVRRAAQLRKVAKNFRPDLAVSHGSRSQIVAAASMGVPSVVMMDYEYTEAFFFKRFTRYILMPSLIPEERLAQSGFPLHKILRYDGFKEEIYLEFFRPDPAFRVSIGIPNDAVLLTLRPCAMTANYHDQRSEYIMLELLGRALAQPGVIPFVVTRTKEDRRLIDERFRGRVRFLEKPVDGLQLIWASDLTVSGGGTMNREAALLGVPTYSIFTGRKPYLDEYLARQKRLVFVDTLEKVNLVRMEKRCIPVEGPDVRKGLAEAVVNIILDSR